MARLAFPGQAGQQMNRRFDSPTWMALASLGPRAGRASQRRRKKGSKWVWSFEGEHLVDVVLSAETDGPAFDRATNLDVAALTGCQIHKTAWRMFVPN